MAMVPTSNASDGPTWYERVVRHRGCLAALWGVCFLAAGTVLHLAWHTFDDAAGSPPERCRADGNCGHAQIDFGGQWVMGRMIVTGRGRQLYHRQQQWLVVQEGFDPKNEPAVIREQVLLPPHARRHLEPEDDVRHDAEKLMSWFMGEDAAAWSYAGGAVGATLAVAPQSPVPLWHPLLLQAAQETLTPQRRAELEKPAIGGPLYPPIHALLYAPLGLLPPQIAYRLFQVLALLLVFLAGRAASRLTHGWIPWPMAVLGLLFYPGTRAALDLGQNPTVTLNLLLWGWLAFCRKREVAAGVLWGCLAFKPVWAVAFLLVPLLMRRWIFLLSMIATGLGWILITLPVVGLQCWWDWLEVGKLATALYCVNDNWIHLSRDLHGIPRRILHDFSAPSHLRDTILAQVLAWTLWGTVLLATMTVYLGFAQPRRTVGIGAAFLLLGAWMGCYRFMYYDVLLTALPIVVLLADRRRWFPSQHYILMPAVSSASLTVPTAPLASGIPASANMAWRIYINSFPLTILGLLYLVENILMGLNLQATFALGYSADIVTQNDGTTALRAPQLTTATGIRYPWDTALLFLLWLWCGVQLLRGKERRES
ncbi:glycosyltransferase family 87 protein [Thermogemmata fonticola]|uniref:DUF2029 domain-containing protein n=1 Tax=Thermogemmata fonticola TaxID=2755323 RepID=A0A7V8VBA1_9BACT|nr:glycosyltransferase family 87 protein [Thermogemmata fonticola]MBA2224885.1 DUF2029 domain-containing protein [Thermogemmata fonticola]